MKIRERINLAAGILFTLIIGTLLHFTYEWSGENPFVALYSPVNESVWEHLKLLFFPVLLYTFFEIIVLYKTSGHFLTSRLLAVCIGMFFIASAFFTYTGLLGRDFLALDILIFIFSVLLTFFCPAALKCAAPASGYRCWRSMCCCFSSSSTSFPSASRRRSCRCLRRLHNMKRMKALKKAWDSENLSFSKPHAFLMSRNIHKERSAFISD